MHNLCFLHSGTGKGKSILASNPCDKFSGSSIEKFKKFIKKNGKCKLIGYISYDLAYDLHGVKKTAKDDLKLPKIYFLAFDKWSEFNSKKDLPKEFKISPIKNLRDKNFTTTISKSQYQKAYKTIQKHLIDGDIYQVNLTHRLEAKTSRNPRELFARIIEKNPVDFLAYIEGDGFEILSASPERFIKIENGKIETCPIKGTRPRGRTLSEDEKLKKELIESKKEAAELNMITDLLRNDMGKIAKVGTIKVECHRLIQKCPTVWHTYSRITAELNPKMTSDEALLSMLPGGSITGCPKKRAIEIIDQLEPVTRGIYTGVIGHIDPSGNLDFSIAIRTIIKKGDKLYLQVGGGIVIDSDSKSEYQETLDKARSFMEIL